MSLEDRMANFTFLYESEGPRLNPHIMEKLKPELSNAFYQGTNLRLSPDLPLLLVGPASVSTASPQSSALKKVHAGEWKERGKGTISSEEMLHLQVRKTHREEKV